MIAAVIIAAPMATAAAIIAVCDFLVGVVVSFARPTSSPTSGAVTLSWVRFEMFEEVFRGNVHEALEAEVLYVSWSIVQETEDDRVITGAETRLGEELAVCRCVFSEANRRFVVDLDGVDGIRIIVEETIGEDCDAVMEKKVNPCHSMSQSRTQRT